MLDIKLIRENPEKINELLKRRNPQWSIDEVLQTSCKKEIRISKSRNDEEKRRKYQQIARRNQISCS